MQLAITITSYKVVEIKGRKNKDKSLTMQLEFIANLSQCNQNYKVVESKDKSLTMLLEFIANLSQCNQNYKVVESKDKSLTMQLEL